MGLELSGSTLALGLVPGTTLPAPLPPKNSMMPIDKKIALSPAKSFSLVFQN